MDTLDKQVDDLTALVDHYGKQEKDLLGVTHDMLLNLNDLRCVAEGDGRELREFTVTVTSNGDDRFEAVIEMTSGFRNSFVLRV